MFPHDPLNYALRIFIAVVVGCLASTGHYIKKRYWDMSTKDSFLSYFHWSDPYFRSTLWALLAAEIPLGYSTVDIPLSFDLIAASYGVTGYTVDSIFNRSTEQQV